MIPRICFESQGD